MNRNNFYWSLTILNIYCAGLAMNQIELEKIADYFDRDHDGFIDLSEINSILRGIRRARSIAKRRPVTDSEKIDRAVRDEPLHNHYMTTTKPRHNHYMTTTLPLHNHYISTLPLHNHFIATTQPLHYHYTTTTLPLHNHYTITS